jgi:hypothetical protein
MVSIRQMQMKDASSFTDKQLEMVATKYCKDIKTKKRGLFQHFSLMAGQSYPHLFALLFIWFANIALKFVPALWSTWCKPRSYAYSVDNCTCLGLFIGYCSCCVLECIQMGKVRSTVSHSSCRNCPSGCLPKLVFNV